MGAAPSTDREKELDRRAKALDKREEELEKRKLLLDKLEKKLETAGATTSAQHKSQESDTSNFCSCWYKKTAEDPTSSNCQEVAVRVAVPSCSSAIIQKLLCCC